MTSELKCPICGGDIQYDNSYSTYDCQNNPSEHNASEEVWQALIQSQKDRKELAIKLAQTNQTLEQSEKCCSAWETQALDYKAETIALSGKLEIATKALEDIDMLLHSRKFDITELGRLNIIQHLVSRVLKLTEHKE